MKEMALLGALHGFKPYKDGGGSVTLMLNEPQWHEFMAWALSLHVTMALARINEESSEGGEG